MRELLHEILVSIIFAMCAFLGMVVAVPFGNEPFILFLHMPITVGPFSWRCCHSPCIVAFYAIHGGMVLCGSNAIRGRWASQLYHLKLHFLNRMAIVTYRQSPFHHISRLLPSSRDFKKTLSRLQINIKCIPILLKSFTHPFPGHVFFIHLCTYKLRFCP